VAAEPPFMAQLPPITRISRPTFSPDTQEVYVEAIEALETDGVPYMLGGALAFNHHTGIWRDTKDLDVFCKPTDAPRLLKALASRGFTTEVIYESWLGKGWKGKVFVDVIWRNANALFPVTNEWLRHAPTMDLFGRQVRVVPLEELLLSKMMVMGRYRFDGADMMHILHAAAEKVDWDRLAEGAGEHVGLLLAYLHMYRWGYPGWKDRVPDHVLDRYAQLARERPSTFGEFRALLVDIQSFQVDVEDWGMPDPHKQALTDIFGHHEGRS
jgi:hypothetical protein